MTWLGEYHYVALMLFCTVAVSFIFLPFLRTSKLFWFQFSTVFLHTGVIILVLQMLLMLSFMYTYVYWYSPFSFFFKTFNWTLHHELLHDVFVVLDVETLNFDKYFVPFIFVLITITILAVLTCATYSVLEVWSFSIFCVFLLFFGVISILTNSFVVFFFSYESLLLPSFYILYKYAKTRRCIEAAYLMFFWTQFGALFLIFFFFYVSSVSSSLSFSSLILCRFTVWESNMLFILLLIAFGVKIPIWPFYGWLPKAHVEASTNFSIFLSGVLVKFAFFGFIKCSLNAGLEPTCFFLIPFLVFGILEVTFKLFYQIDLKKLVAYATVVEMHWLMICVVSGQSCLWLAAFSMLISHALLSSSSFLLVDSINRRYKTRLISEITGVCYLAPKLFIMCFFNLILFLGFPGTIFFIAETLFFSFCFDYLPIGGLLIMVCVYFFLPVFFFKTWAAVLFGTPNVHDNELVADLDFREIITLTFLFGLLFWLGFSWSNFVDL